MKYFGQKAVGVMALATVIVLAASSASQGAAPDELAAATALGLKDVVRRVVDFNETNQIRMLEVAVSKRRVGAEESIFTPDFVASAEHVDSHRPNTEEERRNLGLPLAAGRSVFNERNNNYNAGVEWLVSSGGKLRVGTTLRDLSNDLNAATKNEYVSTVGVSLTQPLLRGGGTAVTMANIRVAAISSEIAFQDYRKNLMGLVAAAEASYWDLYLTQEQYRLSQESVKLAQTILKDNEEKEKAGKSSTLEVFEARSGLAVRQSRQSEAYAKLFDAINRLSSLYSSTVVEKKEPIKATDTPLVYQAPDSYYDSWRQAFDLNPDYLTRRKQATLEGVRVAYARNQDLPQLDLKASYGLNGLGFSPEASFDDVARVGYQAWTISAELRIPIGSKSRGRYELSAARLREKQALLGIRDIEVQISNGLDSSIRKLRSSKESVESFKSVVEFSEQVLQSQQARLDAGKTDTRTVLETENKVFEARLSVLDALVQHQHSKLEWEFIEGTMLSRRNLDLTKEQIEQRTRTLADRGVLTENEYKRFLSDVREDYDRKSGEMRQANGTVTPALTPAEQDKLIQTLREKIKETK